MARTLLLERACALSAAGLIACSSPEVVHRPEVGQGVGPIDVEPDAQSQLARSMPELQSLVDAEDGPDRIELAPGLFQGNLVIRRPLEIVGRPGAVLDGRGSGTVVRIEADDVIFRNATVRGSGRRHTAEDAGIRATGSRIVIAHVDVSDALFGVSLARCRECEITASRIVGADDDPELRGDAIKLWESDRALVAGCHVARGRDVVVWYSRDVVVDDTVVETSRYGAHFMYSHRAKVRGSTFRSNVVGVFVMYSKGVEIEDTVVAGARGAAGYGLGFKESDDIVARGNQIAGNAVGIYLDATPRAGTAMVRGNLIAHNESGVRVHGPSTPARFEENDLSENIVTVEVDGGGSAGEGFTGNYYGEYEGYDLDADGVGDVPHVARALSNDLADQQPSLRFFRGTTAMGVVDAIAHAVPVLEPRPIFTDPRPLIRPRWEER